KHREKERENRITRRERRDNSDSTHFQTAIERKHRHRVASACENPPRPRVPTRTVEQMAPGSRKDEPSGQEQKTPRLHVKQRTKRADAPRNKASKKIRSSPRKGCGQAKQDSHETLLGLAFHGEAELSHNLLQVLPNVALGGGIPK